MDNNLKKKTLLVFPPFMYQGVREPYLSVPLLTGYLRRKNIPVDQRDLNVEFYHHIINRDTMQRIVNDYERRLTEYEQGEDDTNGNEDDSGGEDQYQVLLEKLFEASSILKNLDWMKTDRTYCVHAGFALQTFNNMFEKVPSLEDFKNIEQLVQNENNPFTGIFREIFVEDIAKRGYRTVGISISMGIQLIPALTLARLISDADAGIHITLGGASINLADDEILIALGSLPYVHSIVRFGSGKTLYELIDALAAGRELKEIPNVIDCTPGKPVFPSSYDMPAVEDESDPVFDETFLSYYPERYYLPVMYAIGCYWGRCSYCSNVEQTKHHFLLKKPEQFVDEIEILVKRHNQKRFTFIGECLPPTFAEAIADEIIKRKLDLRFWSYIRIDGKFTREIIEKLAGAGCNKVTIGAESTENRILKLMKKGYTRDMIFRQLQWVKDAGIEIKFNIIWDFPGTTKDEALKILATAESLKNQINNLTIFNFSLEKNSDIGRSPGKFGITIINDQTGSSTMQSMKSFFNELIYVDKQGMSLQDKESLNPLFQKLSLDILVREKKKELNLDNLQDSPWENVLNMARKFVYLKEIKRNKPTMDGMNRGTAKYYYCYHILNNKVKYMDSQRFYYLEQLITEHSGSLEELAETISKKNRQPLRLTRKRLNSVIEEFVIP